MASRPSLTPGSARGDARETGVARTVMFVPREHAKGTAANDNAYVPAGRLLGWIGTGAAMALAVGLYLLLS